MISSFVIISVAFVLFGQGLYLPQDKLQKKPDAAEEIQHAICKIASKDLEATANATIFRELKGVCTSNELEARLNHIENIFVQQIESIKNILVSNGFEIPQVETATNEKQESPETLHYISTPPVISYRSSSSEFGNNGYFNDELHQPTVEQENHKLTGETTSSREEEIIKYNNTVIETGAGKTYIYYWKIRNVDELLRKKNMYVSSQEFSVLGHNLHLQLYPNHLDSESFAVRLAVSTKGFVKKHRIYLLSNSERADVDSGLLLGFKGADMFVIDEETARLYGYIKGNCMTVKIEIMLNS
ncbi:unnamed protein product [Phyllotreta striolata]|uniref:Uncharacterized protein n=1 Tax=Phyllotreta striolata TaxID=444603 RepID=A0A9N9TSH3_PHYSR|nr:unnamed protein product [Phyllotreta striolata]